MDTTNLGRYLSRRNRGLPEKARNAKKTCPLIAMTNNWAAVRKLGAVPVKAEDLGTIVLLARSMDNRSWETHASVKFLAAQLGWGREKVMESLERLRQASIIEREHGHPVQNQDGTWRKKTDLHRACPEFEPVAPVQASAHDLIEHDDEFDQAA